MNVLFRIVLVLGLLGAGAAVVVRNTAPAQGVPQPDSTLWEEAAGPYLPVTAALLERGEAIYVEECEKCHGPRGEGDGSGAYFLQTKPRNFAMRTFKFRTTTSGMPADQDIFRSVTVGFEAYGMPSFRSLSIRDRWAVVHYVKSLAEAGTRRALGKTAKQLGEDIDPKQVAKLMRAGPAFQLPEEPPTTDLVLGRKLFEQHCVKCHGPEGRGDGPSATPDMKDVWGRAIQPRDLRAGRRFRKTGWRARDIARVIVLGIGGTPMPKTSLADAHELWSLARYVESIGE
ncbi:MAG: c-type cytochrome [Planctomycetota bacterium]|jgi:mono/diheme cytochrome c family protein